MVDEHQENPEMPASNAEPNTESTPLREFMAHQRKAAEEASKAFEALFPLEFREHGRAAKKEFVAGLKVLFEGAVSAVDREMNKMHTPKSSGSDSSGPSTTGKSKVKVEVS
jgi:hypothetical protein